MLYTPMNMAVTFIRKTGIKGVLRIPVPEFLYFPLTKDKISGGIDDTE